MYIIYRSTKSNKKTITKGNVMKNNSKKSDQLFMGVLELIASRKGSWSGTMTELRSAVAKMLGKSVVPGSPSAMRLAVNKIVNRVRNAGVSVRFGRTNSKRFVKFTLNTFYFNYSKYVK